MFKKEMCCYHLTSETIVNVGIFEEHALNSNRNPGDPRHFGLKLNITLEESTQLLKVSDVSISRKCIQVTNDFMGVGHFMNIAQSTWRSCPQHSQVNQTKTCNTKDILVP